MFQPLLQTCGQITHRYDNRGTVVTSSTLVYQQKDKSMEIILLVQISFADNNKKDCLH